MTGALQGRGSAVESSPAADPKSPRSKKAALEAASWQTSDVPNLFDGPRQFAVEFGQ
ncbi:MAG: hypothetical protein JWL93_1044, partial [Hyphomicrobiales bacterium]|nr:hypothetical protein [Hyphomicrobiales bacterium]